MSWTYFSTVSSMPLAFWPAEPHTAKSPSATRELPPTMASFSTTLTSAPAIAAS